MKFRPAEYICEVCNMSYLTPEDALKCENRITPEYPIGLIYGNHRSASDYGNMTFCVGSKPESDRHTNKQGSWACRDNGSGDNFGKELCASGNGLHLTEHDSFLNHDHPTFKRMVAYLKSVNISILIWNGSEAISYKENL